MDYALKILMKSFKGCSRYNICQGKHKETKIIDGLKTYFAEVKKNYPGTIDSKVNIVKKSVTSIIQNYSHEKKRKYKRI